ncbi:MAG TPA: hypothetical protein VF008_31705 [Niastella sp.]
MHLTLTKPQVLDLTSALWKKWWNGKPKVYPSFTVELQYVDFFYLFLQPQPIDPAVNIIPVMRKQLELPLKKISGQMIAVLDKQKPEGAAIIQRMKDNRLILRRLWRNYNLQVSGKNDYPLTKEVWEDYNHWRLALTLWEGFVRSFEKGFTIELPEETYGSKRVLQAESNKPLWGMWWAFEELGRVYISSYKDNESISLFPYKSWVRYRKQV